MIIFHDACDWVLLNLPLDGSPRRPGLPALGITWNVGQCRYGRRVNTSLHVHGSPGRSLREDGARMYGAAARRGAFIEEATARALERWLSGRPDCAGLHLFHDLGGFRDVTGCGLPPLSLGTANIDHVILSGGRWLLVDAKGTAPGTLTTDSAGRGVLIEPDGSRRPEPWLDNTKMRSAAGVLVRLTGLRGWPVWVVPDATEHDPGVLKARAFAPGGAICTIGDVYSGSLDEVLAVPQSPADPAAVAALARYLSSPPVSVSAPPG